MTKITEINDLRRRIGRLQDELRLAFWTGNYATHAKIEDELHRAEARLRLVWRPARLRNR